MARGQGQVMTASDAPAARLPRYREREIVLEYIADRHRLSNEQFDVIATALEDLGLAPMGYVPRVQ
jgi:hypothetical protein